MHIFSQAFLFFCVALIESNAKRAPVLLVSLDGFRSSVFEQYLIENPSSNFHRIINVGVKAEYMRPSFPSATFPNHITIITGLYPESHGDTC